MEQERVMFLVMCLVTGVFGFLMWGTLDGQPWEMEMRATGILLGLCLWKNFEK